MKKMKVDKLGMDLLTHDPVVILKDMEGHRYLPILVGPFEAAAIAFALEGTSIPRPLTHDLMKNILLALGAKVISVQINELQNNTFFAKLILEKDGQIMEIDSRPSDSIAIALRTDAPIYVSNRIFLEETVLETKPSEYQESTFEAQDKQKFKKYIDNLKPSDFMRGFENSESLGNIKDLTGKEEKNSENSNDKNSEPEK